MEEEFTSPSRRTQFIWVKDRSGNEYACNADFLRNPNDISDEELRNCINDGSVPQASAGG